MKIFHTYILFSAQLNRYYVGSTSLSVDKRLQYHLSNHKGFTAKAKDWVIVFEQHFETIQQARVLERKIKKRGAKRFIED